MSDVRISDYRPLSPAEVYELRDADSDVQFKDAIKRINTMLVVTNPDKSQFRHAWWFPIRGLLMITIERLQYQYASCGWTIEDGYNDDGKCLVFSQFPGPGEK